MLIFLVDPLSIALTGGDVRLLPYLIRAMVGAIAFMCGELYAAFNEHGAMVGFQGWVAPGDVLFSTYVFCYIPQTFDT